MQSANFLQDFKSELKQDTVARLCRCTRKQLDCATQQHQRERGAHVQPGYQRLTRNEEPRGTLREVGLGIVLLAAVVIGCLFLPAFPEEPELGAVATAPPQESHEAAAAESCAADSTGCLPQ